MRFSRRAFVGQSLAAALAAAVGRPSLLSAHLLRSDFTLLRRGVGIYTDRGGTMGWLVNADGIAVVDSQFADTAGTFLAGLRGRSPLPIDVLFNTHHHPDHSGGNAVLRGAAQRIVAHTRSAENQRTSARARGVEADQAYPDTTFQETWSAEVGDERIRAKHFGPAHTGGDVAVFFENANVVHLGDLLNNRGYPNVDAPAGASVQGWIRVLEAIAAEYAQDTLYVFGHSEAGFPVTGGRDDLYFQRDYFLAVVEHAERGVRQGRSREEVTALDALPGFTHFGGTFARLGLGLGVAFDEITSGV
jgi:cyclase